MVGRFKLGEEGGRNAERAAGKEPGNRVVTKKPTHPSSDGVIPRARGAQGANEKALGRFEEF